MSEEITQSFAKEVLRLGYEVRDLAKERDALKEHIKYLEIELKCETGRWERTMEDNARLQAEVERLRKAGDAVCESPYLLETDPAVFAWRAAKEGKQP